MASAAQINANRVNAQHSTGPSTPEGKSRVAHNAIRHGLTSTRLIVRSDEQEEFAELQISLRTEVDPQGALESITFDELLHAAWNLHRFRRVEAECFTGDADPLTDPDAAALLDRIGRYQARSQRAYYRALQELRMLQTERALRDEAFDAASVDAPTTPPLAVNQELAKQTQFDAKSEAARLALYLLGHQSDSVPASDRQTTLPQQSTGHLPSGQRQSCGRR